MMNDYDKLVTALRYHADTTNCDACKLYDAGKCELKSCVLHDSADAIEALQAKVDALKKDNILLLELRGNKLPKRGEWKRIDKHTVQCPECYRYLDLRGVNAGRGDANYCPQLWCEDGGTGCH